MQITPLQAEGFALRDPHPNGKSTIFGLQALRFIAAAIVVVTHVLNREVNLYHPYPIPRAPWMEAGVDIFFVISGFIMVYILKPDDDAWAPSGCSASPVSRRFTGSRRPIALLRRSCLPDWFFGHQGWSYALQSVLFVPVGVNSDAHPLISPGWTLIYEFAFYSILAICLMLRRPPFALATVASSIGVGRHAARTVAAMVRLLLRQGADDRIPVRHGGRGAGAQSCASPLAGACTGRGRVCADLSAVGLEGGLAARYQDRPAGLSHCVRLPGQ